MKLKITLGLLFSGAILFAQSNPIDLKRYEILFDENIADHDFVKFYEISASSNLVERIDLEAPNGRIQEAVDSNLTTNQQVLWAGQPKPNFLDLVESDGATGQPLATTRYFFDGQNRDTSLTRTVENPDFGPRLAEKLVLEYSAAGIASGKFFDFSEDGEQQLAAKLEMYRSPSGQLDSLLEMTYRDGQDVPSEKTYYYIWHGNQLLQIRVFEKNQALMSRRFIFGNNAAGGIVDATIEDFNPSKNKFQSSLRVEFGTKSAQGTHPNVGLEAEARPAFSLAPNPVRDLMRVDYSGMVEMQLYDLGGRLVKEFAPLAAPGLVSLAEIGNGFYILKARGDGLSKSIRILKK